LLKQFNLKPEDIEQMRKLAMRDHELARMIEEFRQKQTPGDFERWLKQPQMSEDQLKLFQKLAEKLKRRSDDFAFPPKSKQLPPTDPTQQPPLGPMGREPSSNTTARPSRTSERWTEFLTKNLDKLADG